METLTDLERDCLARAVRHIIGSKDKDERDLQCRLLKQETGIVLEYEFEKTSVNFSWYKSEQINVDTNVQLMEEANRRMEQKNEESEFLKLKSGMSEIEARLFNRKMRRAYKFHRAEPWKI